MKFKINAKEEAKNIPYLVNKLAGERILEPTFLKRIKSRKKLDYKKIVNELKKAHLEKNKELEKKLTFAKNFWRKNEKSYTAQIEKILEVKKIEKNKTFYFSPVLYGIADVLGRKNVFVGCEWNGIFDYLLIHELTHLHYSDALVKLKLFKQGGKSPLMEGIDHLIVFKTPIKNLIKSRDAYYENIYFVKENRKFMNELEILWNTRKNFKSFMEEAIKLNEKTTGVKIC